MKTTIKYIIILSITLIFSACGQDCNCTEDWDENITYVKDDLVNHDGKCWIAVAQGRGIVPGPWLENGNDIWEECDEE